jgi:hypothetical protein
MPIYRWRHKENTVYMHSGVLLSHKQEWNLVQDRTREHYVKWNKIGTEGQIPHVLFHMWKLKEVYVNVVMITRGWEVGG